jgi:hypothetical protein
MFYAPPKPPNGVHNPPGRAMQDLPRYKTNYKRKSADATRADRPGRVHAVLARALLARFVLPIGTIELIVKHNFLIIGL